MFAVAIATMLPATSAAMTKLYTEYLVSTDGKNTVLYTGATSRGSSKGITYTKERARLNAQGYVNWYVNYYVTGTDKTKYYLLAGAMREGDIDYDEFVQLPFPETYKRVVNGDTATHYAYNYGEYREFLDWNDIEQREWRLSVYGSQNEFQAQFRISATNKWDRYETMLFPNPEIIYDQIVVAAPAKQMCRIDYECNLSYSSGGGTGEMASQVVTNSGVVAENSFTREGYTFDGWLIGSTKYSSGQQLSNLKDDMNFTATWKPNTYTVTFNANGGSVSLPTKSVTYASPYGQLPDSTRDGYKFNGWYTSATSGSPIDSSTTVTITTDQTLYAHWTANSYTVAFNANGGAGSMSSQAFTYGTAQNLTQNSFTRTGYTFAGWNTKEDGSGTSYSNKQSVSNLTTTSGATVTLYAKWTANTYTVAFNNNGGTGTMSSQSFTYDVSQALTANSFTRTGYTFAGWNRNADGMGTLYSNKQSVSNLTAASGGTVTLYAKWTANKYTVAFKANGGPGGDTTKEVTYGSQYGSLPTPTYGGNTFNGWYTAVTGGSKVTSTTTVATAQNHNLYAHWTANTYTVTLDKQSGTGGTDSVTATYNAAMPALESLPTRMGYAFNGYYDAASGGTQYYKADGSSARTWNKTAATTLYAHWTANTYTVTLNQQSGTGGTSSVTATYGSAMPPATMPTRTGYTFAGYYDATSGGTQYYKADGTSAKTWDKTGAQTLYARWTAKTYTITLDRQGGTGGSTSVSATYNSAMPSATMPTRTGYTFGGYFTETGGEGVKCYNADGSSARTWNTASAATLYAKWTANTYTVTLDKQGGSGGTSSVTATYNAAMPALESLPTRAGYAFNGYYDAASGGTQHYKANGASAKTWDKTAATTLYAQWTAYKYELGYDNLFLFYDWRRSASAELKRSASGEELTLGDGTVKIKTGTVQHVMTKYGASADFYNIPVQPNTTYRFSCTLEGISQRSQVYWVPITSAFAYVDASPYYRTLTVSSAEGDKTATFTTPANCAYVQLFFDVHDVDVYMTFESIKLTKEAPFGSVTATAVRKSYTYNDNGTTKYGTLATATRTGYTFAGWYTAESGGDQVTENSSVLPQCSTIWSRWTANTYTVAFNANGGSGTMSNETFTYDTAKALTANAFTRAGYTFVGWNTKSDGTGTPYSNEHLVLNLTATSGGTVTLYAQWTANTYIVTLDRQSGSGGTASVTATYGSAMPPIESLPTRVGYSFEGYYDATSDGTQYYKANGSSAHKWDKTTATKLYARWTANTYMVTLDKQSGSGGPASVTATYNNNMPFIGVPARNGYTFGGYYDQTNGGGTQYYNADGSSAKAWDTADATTLYAKWTAKTYTITFNANGGVGGISQELEYGVTIVAPTVTREGYTFSGWQPAVPATVSGPATYEAQWTVNKYTITFDANGGKGGSSTEMDYGADIVAPTVTREGYTFSVWQPAVPNTVPASNATYVAQWIADLRFTITFEVDGGAFIDPATNSVNTVYTNGCAYGWLPIATKKNHEFAGWWTSQEPTNRVQQLATNIATNTISKLYARWKESLPMVTVSEDSNSTNVVWGTEFGDLKMIPSTVPDGKYFAWWCDTDGKPIADDYVVTNDITVTPQWSVVDILRGEVAFEKDEWTYANGGFRSKSMPKESNDSRSLIAKLRYAGTISFDYAALLTRIDDSRAKLVLKSDDGNTAINFPSGEIYGRTNAVANGVFEWTISGRWANSINDYAAISNIQYNIATSEWVDAWCSTNSSTRTLKLVTPAEAGVLSFNWRVNGETGYVDTNGVYRLCDRLSFRELGGTSLRVEGFSEENGFTHVCVTNKNASSHVFVWRYEKDYDCDAGDDAAWIKDIVWTPLAPSAEDTVIEYTSLDGTEMTVSIPNSWIDGRNLRTGEMSYIDAVSEISATSGLPYWVGYIIGEDPDAELRITDFAVHAGTIAIGWAPNRSDRVYTIWGKTNLTDAAWHTPTNSATRFFTVEVSMPK